MKTERELFELFQTTDQYQQLIGDADRIGVSQENLQYLEGRIKGAFLAGAFFAQRPDTAVADYLKTARGQKA